MSVELWISLWVLGAAVFVTWHAYLTAPEDPEDPGFPEL